MDIPSVTFKRTSNPRLTPTYAVITLLFLSFGAADLSAISMPAAMGGA